MHALLGASKIEEARALSLSCCVLAAGNGRLEPPKSDQPGRAAFYQYMLIGENEFTQYEWRTLMHELTMYTSLFILHVIDTRLNARITHQFRVEESRQKYCCRYESVYFWHAMGLPEDQRKPDVAELNKIKCAKVFC